MREESKWIKENIIECDKGDIRRRLKAAINFKTKQNELLEEASDITGTYTLLGLSIKELGRTAEVMYGYNADATRIYADYLAQAITDRLRAKFGFDILEAEDHEALVQYGTMLMDEMEKLCSRDVFYTLDGLYKVFK
ncbi:MAG: hypothetical protein ACRC6T_02705 [Sarcina sp.]